MAQGTTKTKANADGDRPELIVGLVGALGVDLEAVSSALSKAFDHVAYQTRRIRLIDPVLDFPRWRSTREETRYDLRYGLRMDAGNEFRETLERKDALALLAMVAIRNERQTSSESDHESDRFIPECAFLLQSLKTEEEIARLRETYGSNCLIVAAYAPRRHRVERLARRIAASHHSDGTQYRSQAEALVLRDENERGKSFGQNVRDTFPLADVFLDASSPDQLERDAQRFVEVLFAHPYKTPTRHEFGMFQAFGAARCSSSAGRQVGATITKDGDVVAVGTNEVAKAHGGPYWEGDDPDQRDHQRPRDSTSAITQSILADLIARLRKLDWLSDDKSALSLDQLLERALADELMKRMDVIGDDPPSLADKAQLSSLIEFIRAVHAEMAALMSAARRGTSVQGCTLYSTSFPCHECARHIVAAGIENVYFIESYPKSRVTELYDDSIAVDEDDDKRVRFRAFTGIAPRVFLQMFAMPKRKTSDDTWVDWDEIRKTNKPRVGGPAQAYLEAEAEWVAVLDKELRAHKLEFPDER